MSRSAQRVQFEGHRGHLLAGIVEMPAHAPRAMVVFSHCFTCNKDLKAIVRISRGLADQGWGVLRYDFAGLGNSQGTFSETNFSTNQQDLLAAVHFLQKQYVAPKFLIGHSFGGAASLSMADSISSVVGVVALAAPSDTIHLADLLLRMDPAIATHGVGTVTIGGRAYEIKQQMVDDFRSQNLLERIANLTKPILTFHSPVDETVGFRHALINSGYQSADGAIRVYDPSTRPERSLFALPMSNHLLTNNDHDIPMIVGVMDAWFARLVQSDA